MSRRYRLIRRLRPSHWMALDAACAIVLTAAYAGTLAAHPAASTGPVTTSLGYGLAVLLAAPIALRRRWPVAVLAVVVAADLGTAALGLTGLSPLPATVLALYSTAATQGPKVAVAALTVTEAGTSAAALVEGGPGRALPVVLVQAVAWVIGTNVRVRRAHVTGLEERAVLLEREREERARQAVTEERLRIAREMHDVVAHALAVIAVQSGVGHHLLDSHPEDARAALAAIQATSREALADARRLLGVLREEGEPGEALPGLGALDQLLARVAGAGVTVQARIDGVPVPLPASVDLVAYRVIQEALTNTIKHAAPTRARVRIAYRPDTLVIHIADDGPAGAQAGPAPCRRRGMAVVSSACGNAWHCSGANSAPVTVAGADSG